MAAYNTFDPACVFLPGGRGDRRSRPCPPPGGPRRVTIARRPNVRAELPVGTPAAVLDQCRPPLRLRVRRSRGAQTRRTRWTGPAGHRLRFSAARVPKRDRDRRRGCPGPPGQFGPTLFPSDRCRTTTCRPARFSCVRPGPTLNEPTRVAANGEGWISSRRPVLALNPEGPAPGPRPEILRPPGCHRLARRGRIASIPALQRLRNTAFRCRGRTFCPKTANPPLR